MNALRVCLLLFAGMFLSVNPIPAAANFGFSLQPSVTDIRVGDAFDLDLVLHDAFSLAADDELLAFGLNAQILDGAGLILLGSSVNPLFFDDTGLLDLDAAGSAFPGIAISDDFPGDFTLASLHFQALQAGAVTVEILSNLSTGFEGVYFMANAPVAIEVRQQVSVSNLPLPTAAWLFLFGLVSLLSGMRKRL
ncbi:hypothetical protein [Methylomonas sp. HYX-M1]|uniref:hypothetical protein n=1 Tax=Methylomonas sp. HYX-M1 TaxID=3139307 RepID=UPI00345C078C